MSADIFREVSFWKSACISMSDNSFFELMRSVLGKIKTPFNKQQLLNDLEKFLLRTDIQRTIAAYIDETDAKIINAVALFGEPVLEQLESFFADELSYARLQDHIVNMEERFILYRFTDEEKTNMRAESRLALNPVLRQILLPVASDASSLFPATVNKKNSSAASKTAVNDLTLAALYSFILRQESFYRPENVIRKKITEKAKTLFAGLDFKNILGSLQILGLFYADGEKLFPDKKRFNDFTLLSARERMEYCAASILIYSSLTPPFETLPPLFRAKIHETAAFIHSFLDSLNADFVYPEKTLFKIMEIIGAKTGCRIDAGNLLETLHKTGLLNVENGTASLIRVNREKRTEPVIAFDSASSILVYPEIDFADALKLAFILDIRETGSAGAATVVRFELDKESAVRAFDNNIGADEIIELLKNLCGGKDRTKGLSDAFIWNLKDWEKRHGEVSLKKGIVLQLSKEHQYLTDTSPLSSLIAETLAPGIYFINENAMDDTTEALRKAGVDIIAHYTASFPAQGKREISIVGGGYFSPPSLRDFPSINISDAAQKESGDLPENADALTEGFRSILEKMKLSEAEKNELSARIDRRLVLCEAQLKDAEIRYEKLEARHMDYAGKQNIAKQAITQQSPLELELQQDKRIFGIPKSLEKENNELILVILPDEQEALRIPLAKIKLLRRIKKSIFS